MKLSSIPLAIVFVLGFSLAAQAQGERIRIATEGAYEPFNYIDENGRLTGFDVEIAEAICRDLGADCTFAAVPWDTIFDGLANDDYDLVVASVAFTPQRAERMEYSDSYYRSHSMFAGDGSRITDTTPNALAGIRIAVAEETVQAEYVRRFYGQSEIILAEDIPGALALLEAGRADLVLSDAIQLLTWMQTAEGSRFQYIGDPVTGEFLQSSAHITAQKGETELVERVNQALKHIRLDGTYDRINSAYFPFSIS